MKKQPRLPPRIRRTLILEAAIHVAERLGFRSFTREDVANEAGVSPALVTTRLGCMEDARAHVMKEAVKRHLLPIVAAGIAEGHPVARRAPKELKAQC